MRWNVYSAPANDRQEARLSIGELQRLAAYNFSMLIGACTQVEAKMVYISAYNFGKAQAIYGANSLTAISMKKGLEDSLVFAAQFCSSDLINEIVALGRRHSPLFK